MNNNVVVPVFVNGSLQYVPLHILLQSGQQYQGANFNQFGGGTQGGRRRRSRRGNQNWQSMQGIPFAGSGIPFGMTPYPQGYGFSQRPDGDRNIRKTLRRLEQQIANLTGGNTNLPNGQRRQPQQPQAIS